MIRALKALSTSVRIRCDDSAIGNQLDALFATFPSTDEAPVLDYRIERGASGYQLCRNQELVYSDSDADAMAPALELDLYRQVPRLGAGAWVLHGAGIVRNEKAIVLCGPSGAGKTTVTRALLDRGWLYLSEEMCSIDRDGWVRGLRRPLHTSAESGHARYRLRDELGRVVERGLWLPRAEQMLEQARLGVLVLLSYTPNRDTTCERVGSGEALVQAWTQTLDVRPWALATATKLLRGIPCVRLQASDRHEAIAALETLAKEIR